jgi:tetratricopeptide (TPR) repeat protein
MRQKVYTICLGLAIAASLAGCQQATDQGTTGKVPITTSSEEARQAYLAGRDLQEKLRVTDSREHFQSAVELDPEFGLAQLALANTAPTNVEFFEALGRARELLDEVTDGERLMIQATVAGVNGQPDNQEQLLQELVAAYPSDERAQQLIGNFYFFTSQEYARAVEFYRRASEINPEFSPAFNLLGYGLRILGDYEGAETAFQRYIQLIPDEPNPYDSYAELLMRVGRFEESIVQYEKALEQNPNFIPSYVGIGANLILMGQFDQARESFARLESRARTDAERRQAQTWTAYSYLHQQGYDRALELAQRRYDIAAATDDLGPMSADLNFMGDILLAAGRFDEADAKYRESVDAAERSVLTEEAKQGVRRNHIADLARVELARGDLDAASAHAQEYRRQAEAQGVPFEIRQWHELFGLLALQERRYDEAIEHLEQANRQDARVLLAHAKALWGRGDDEAARAMCSEAANLNPTLQAPQNFAIVRPEALALLDS